ncbi:MAG TPA: hypothetical protein VM582_02110 [Candidatus Thermoplasmatota archaeon]|nr:hypothetical protein [Candidatus Thermoplasmatota archaeon]
MRALIAVAVLGTLFLSGALGEAYLPNEVPFSAVERQHFNAVAVLHERQAPSQAPLVIRVNIVGDAADADVTEAFEWLRTHANIVVVRDAAGAPLFLTNGDLAATSGRGTLGATVREGMAVEMRDPRISPCVIAHELLHFAGLKHVPDRTNIMYPHCSKDFLRSATITEQQLAQLATLDAIRATTPGGVQVWATR